MQHPSIGGLLNTFYCGPGLSCCVFWGSFVPLSIQPPVLGSPSEGLGADLLTRCWQICLFWTAVMMREQSRGNGGEDVERERGESEEWREGEHRWAVLQILRGRASPLFCPPCFFAPPPLLLCHSGLDYFILIRLIPPRGKLLITSPPPAPPDVAISFQREDRMRVCSAW